MTLRLHFGPKPLSKLALRTFPQKVGGKPSGTWYSCGRDWVRWLASESPKRLREVKWVTALEPDMRRMLALGSMDEVKCFAAAFGVERVDEMDPTGRDKFHFIDWAAVAKEYAGVEFCPYLRRFRKNFEWYYALDVASGCVWDPSALKIVGEERFEDVIR